MTTFEQFHAGLGDSSGRRDLGLEITDDQAALVLNSPSLAHALYADWMFHQSAAPAEAGNELSANVETPPSPVTAPEDAGPTRRLASEQELAPTLLEEGTSPGVAGWYRSTGSPATGRWWDGARWSDAEMVQIASGWHRVAYDGRANVEDNAPAHRAMPTHQSTGPSEPDARPAARDLDEPLPPTYLEPGTSPSVAGWYRLTMSAAVARWWDGGQWTKAEMVRTNGRWRRRDESAAPYPASTATVPRRATEASGGGARTGGTALPVSPQKPKRWSYATATLVTIALVSTAAQLLAAASLGFGQYVDWSARSSGGLVAIAGALYLGLRCRSWADWRKRIWPWIAITAVLAILAVNLLVSSTSRVAPA